MTMKANELDGILKQMTKEIALLRRQVAEADVKAEYIWFRNLLVGILNSALDDYKHVEIGAEKSVYLLAWGRRNLLELQVTVDYVLKSEAQALEFRDDLIRDSKEFFEAISKSHKATHKEYLVELSSVAEQLEEPFKSAVKERLALETEEGPKTEASDSEAQMFGEFLSSVGVEDKRPKTPGQLAKIVQQEDGFSPMNRICSKLVHRTALSIASTTSKDSLSAAIPLLKDSAVKDLVFLYGRIKDHVENVGIGVWQGSTP